MKSRSSIPRSTSLVVLLAVCLPLAGCDGCRKRPAAPGTAATGPVAGGASREAVFASAMDGLDRFEQFDAGEVFEQVLARLRPNAPAPADAGTNPLLTTWPEPQMLQQVVERLNQWAGGGVNVEWRRDPMLDGLPASLGKLPLLAELDAMRFSTFDGFALLEAAWLRDLAAWARGNELDDLSRAVRLFDWTVRNISVERPLRDPDGNPLPAIPQTPWESLFFGRGTVWERAWVFVRLARQQGLDAAVLAVNDPAAPDKPPRPWVVAVLIGGEAHLFDPALGLPIPAADGLGRTPQGGLAIRPATLAAIAADAKLLRQMDADGREYPWKAEDLERLAVLLEASPAALSRRMKAVEGQLTGEQKMVLSAAPSLQAERWRALPGVRDVRLWALPYETFQQRLALPPNLVAMRLMMLVPYYGTAEYGKQLRLGRIRQLKGRFAGDESAAVALMQARAADAELADIERKIAKQYYEKAKPGLEQVPREQQAAAQQRLQNMAEYAASLEIAAYVRAKQDASYWLGLLSFERGNYAAAADYLLRRTLEASPDGPWNCGARYNLARTFEASGETIKAIELLRSDRDAPGGHGALLRARWLRQQSDAEKP